MHHIIQSCNYVHGKYVKNLYCEYNILQVMQAISWTRKQMPNIVLSQ